MLLIQIIQHSESKNRREKKILTNSEFTLQSENCQKPKYIGDHFNERKCVPTLSTIRKGRIY